MLPASVLTLLLSACAPNVDATTQAALVAVESGGSAFAISDSNTGRSYYPASYEQAVIIAEHLINDNAKSYGARDAGIGVGVAQIQSTNFTALHLSPAIALDPCVNLRVGSLMLLDAYRTQYAALGGPPSVAHQQKALDRALQVYNSGKPYGVESYVAKVLLASRGALVSQLFQTLHPRPVVQQQQRRLTARVAPPRQDSGVFYDAGDAQARPLQVVFRSSSATQSKKGDPHGKHQDIFSKFDPAHATR